MCGLVGVWQHNEGVDISLIEEMARLISHRGPDEAGVWTSPDGRLGLGHRRLSIIDLSPAGSQPILSSCGNYALVFNGEIYNHAQVRKSLERTDPGLKWRGHSDTEVLVELLAQVGVKDALPRLNGMFAFAFFDLRARVLTLARDRMGEKPLFFGHVGGAFVFASELKALKALPLWSGKVNRNSLALYLRHNCVPAPHCIYDGLHKLPAGSFIEVSEAGGRITDPNVYWDVAGVARWSEESTEGATDVHAVLSELDSLLSEAVSSRMEADVPLGAFLSGGYDSATVVAKMQERSMSRVKTFSIGFHAEEYNEAQHAKKIAEILNTEHTELYLTDQDALDVVPKLPLIYDEPFADSSQIPTFLVSQLARENVKVALSGDGGDELFAGYNRHVVGDKVWRQVNWLPPSVRPLLSQLIERISKYDLTSAMSLLPSHLRAPILQNKLQKLAKALGEDSVRDFYISLSSHWENPHDIVLGVSLTNNSARAWSLPVTELQPRELMQLLDQMTYLPDDILTKVDRASMAVNLEARVPFLDHRLVEFAWSLPDHFKVREGVGKWALREVLHKHIPKEIMQRPKQGFGIPLAEWLRGPLREWADELLSEQRLRTDGFFEPAPIIEKWGLHKAGIDGWQYHIWDVLMFQAWLDENPEAH